MTESIAWFLEEYVTFWAFYVFLVSSLFLLVTGVVTLIKSLDDESGNGLLAGAQLILMFFGGCLVSLGIYKLFIE